MDIIYRVVTKATDSKGQRVRFESFDKKAAMTRAAELKARDPKSRVLGVPVVR